MKIKTVAVLGAGHIKNILFINILLQVVYFVYDAYDLTTRRLLKRICRQT